MTHLRFCALFSAALVLAVLDLGAASPLQSASAQGIPDVRPDTVEVEVRTTLASRDRQPFWLTANRLGVVDPASANAILRLHTARSIDGVPQRSGRWQWGYGASLIGRGSAQATVFAPELYAALRYRGFVLRAGRWAESVGAAEPDVSSGSITTSRNATPVPRITLSTHGYVDVPGSRGYAEVKGRMTHGWLTDDRYVQAPYLHAKHGFVRLGGSWPVRVFGGLVHNAVWAGTSSNPDIGELPGGAGDLWRVVTAQNATDPDAPLGEQIYVQGNHLGMVSFGVEADVGPYRLQIHRDFFFDDEDGLELDTPQDALMGVSLRDARPDPVVEALTYEYIYTKWQSGPRPPGPGPPGGEGIPGNDNFYNNNTYRSGWTYEGRTIGTPLFVVAANGRGVESNRIVAHHLGVAGHATSTAEYRVLATYVRHYGTYRGIRNADGGNGSYAYRPYRTQYSLLFESTIAWPGAVPLHIRAGVGIDAGTLYEDAGIGGEIALLYRVRP